MNIGMLWFDSSKTPLSSKIRKAMEYHEQKYGKPPTLVELPLNEENVEGLDIRVKKHKYIPAFHMLVGIEGAGGAENE